ncbi:stage V sporulation protein AD [Intestinibacillus massiliensis]|uniref:stage V sporulation protein AD n=1 Tax=Intestinibacillus massiliensis TaxID=1871029 RepID=UPI000B351811|nr:stage V sporulation protein AD [Intestinibacillus massiliensis]
MAVNRMGARALRFRNAPRIAGHAAVVGKKEGEGPLRGTFDYVAEDDHFDQPTWEKAESEMQRRCIELAARKAGREVRELNMILAGDLLNQCIGSAFASSDSNVPFLGLYGACSTMAQGLLLGACLVDGGFADELACAASSHFCSAERQYRFPLAYGGQRTPTAQWTATASGAAVIAAKPERGRVAVTGGAVGQMVDLGVKDANNMGAAMAPAAYRTLSDYFRDTATEPGDYDMVLTGDLAGVGADLLIELFKQDGVDIRPVYSDCGLLLFSPDQDVHAGGSGCGCSACVLCGSILRDLEEGRLRRVLFAGTGAMMSPVSVQQGQNIAGVCHAVVLERQEG